MGIRDFLNKLTKKDDLIVDLADLQKRGIYHPGKEMPIEPGSEIIDLSAPRPSSTSKASSDSEGSSALGFLSSLAGSSSSSSADTESTETLSATTVSYSEKKQKLKGILRDMKEKINSCYDETYKLGERIDLLEKKIERLERRSGVQ